jgi:arsenate reductase
LRHHGREAFEVVSAGIDPSFVRREATEVMREIDIDISSHHSKSVDEFIGQAFDYVITVCDNAKQRCPIFPGASRRIHWSVKDPAAVEGDAETRLEAFRIGRDELRERLREFIAVAADGLA